MATLLTTSYKKIGTISLTYDEVRIYAKYTSQNTSTNKTSYSLKTTYYRAEGSLSADSSTSKLDGTSKSFGYTTFKKGETTLQEVTRTITHNNDGSSPTKSVTASMSMSYGGSGSKTVEITFPKINRLATVTKANDFTDEENPTLEFTNPAGFTVYPYLTFYDKDDKFIYELTRTTESATSPYTWEITNEERQTMWEITNKQSSYKVNVGVSTYNGSTKLGNNSKSQTMTYVNADPNESTAFTETNQKVIDVLGTNNAEAIIQNVSQLKLTSTPSVKKEATVSKITFEHGIKKLEDTLVPYESTLIPTLNSNLFKVTVTDSRGYSKTNEYIKSIIEYSVINIDSFSFKRENPTSSNIILNAQIRYVQTNFGSTPNVPTIQWKLGENGQLNTLSADDYTIDTENKKIIISNLILNDVLSYKEQGEFYLYANDLLTSDVETKYPVTKGIPTFDAGEYDFNVNGDLTISNEDGENPVNVLEQITKRKNTITARVNSDTTISSTSHIKLPLITALSSGNLLTLENNGIKIGEGISKVLVSGSVYFTTGINAGDSTRAFIYKNSSNVCGSYNRSNGSYEHRIIPPTLIEVTEGDMIYLYGANATGARGIIGTSNTQLTIEVVE